MLLVEVQGASHGECSPCVFKLDACLCGKQSGKRDAAIVTLGSGRTVHGQATLHALPSLDAASLTCRNTIDTITNSSLLSIPQ